MPKPSMRPRLLIFLAALALFPFFFVSDPASLILPRRHLSATAKPGATPAAAKVAPTIDATNGHGFKLDSKGTLLEAPTLRTQLLNDVAQTNLPAAADLARNFLRSKDSPDAWALSLAILAKADNSQTNRDFVRTKAEEMALYEPWQKDPSAGFLEAFDVFVYMHDTGFTPSLTTMVNDKSNPALAHAAFLTLDRLTQIEPQATLQYLIDKPALLADRAATEAGYFARADVRDSSQRDLLSQYLLSPQRTLPELEAFAGVYPNENFIISHNLLTQNTFLTGVEIHSRIEAASLQVSAWQSDPRFAPLRPQLGRIQNRLGRILGLAAQ